MSESSASSLPSRDVSRPSRRKAIIILLLILAFAFGTRLYELSKGRFRDRDETGTAELIEAAYHGDWKALCDPITGPGIVAPGVVCRLFTDYGLAAGRISSFVAGLAIIVLVFMLALRFLGAAIACIAAFLTACDYNLVINATGCLSESHFTAWLLGGLVVLTSRRQRSHPFLMASIAGLLIGISFLCRPEGFIYGAALIPALIILHAPKSRKSWMQAVVLVLGFAIAAAPYVVGMKAVSGRWQLNGRTMWNRVIDDEHPEETIYGLTDDDSETRWLAAVYDPAFAATLEDDSRDLMDTARVFMTNAQELIERPIKFVPPTYLILFGAGLAGFAATRRGWRLLAAGLWLTLPILTLILTHNITARHFVPLSPFAAIGAAVGVAALAQQRLYMSHLLRPLLHPVTITAAVGLFSLAVAFSHNTEEGYDIGPRHHRMAAWIAAQLPEDAVIMERHAFTSALAGRRSVALPFASYERVLRYATAKQADYLIMETGHLENRPELRFLFDEGGNADWQVIHEETDQDGRIIIFQRPDGSS